VTVRATVRRGAYVDSITLMRVAVEVRRLPGVDEAALLMATPANREALARAGLLPDAVGDAGPDDLLIVVRADSPATADEALAEAGRCLAADRPGGETAAGIVPPRSLTSAARRVPGTTLAVISVPGPHAANEAFQALAAGLDVFIFSDGVPLEDEIALKRRARERGRLVMGPECGTSIIHGVGIGFANRVRRGGIGLVGASGTGLQEVTSLVHRLGAGVSHAIGTGGRDLHDAVGGLTTLQALAALADDPATGVVVVVSKPGSERVAAEVLDAAAGLGKPVVACLLGWPGKAPPGVRAVETLEDAAVEAVRLGGGRPPRLTSPRVPPREGPAGRVLGLFTGGTLAEEARAILGARAAGVVDFGAEEYTRGRPHPMIDPALRSAAIAAAGDDENVGVLLLDFVLGECAHPDPVGAAVPAIDEALARARRRGRRLEVVAHVVGTAEDRQGLGAQERALKRLGAVVCPTNRRAAQAARALAGGPDVA
jgi:FdrA protein